jgi:hypothetical protein
MRAALIPVDSRCRRRVMRSIISLPALIRYEIGLKGRVFALGIVAFDTEISLILDLENGSELIPASASDDNRNIVFSADQVSDFILAHCGYHFVVHNLHSISGSSISISE